MAQDSLPVCLSVCLSTCLSVCYVAVVRLGSGLMTKLFIIVINEHSMFFLFVCFFSSIYYSICFLLPYISSCNSQLSWIVCMLGVMVVVVGGGGLVLYTQTHYCQECYNNHHNHHHIHNPLLNLNGFQLIKLHLYIHSI